jgi:hypothetical protein
MVINMSNEKKKDVVNHVGNCFLMKNFLFAGDV